MLKIVQGTDRPADKEFKMTFKQRMRIWWGKARAALYWPIKKFNEWREANSAVRQVTDFIFAGFLYGVLIMTACLTIIFADKLLVATGIIAAA